MALPRAHRLVRSSDIRGVFSGPVSIKEGRVVMKAAMSKGKEPRFAVVVSKAVHKSAVQRNRIRRLLQEGLRANIQHIGARDVVIIVLRGISLKGAADAQEIVRRLFFKIH